MELNKTVKNAQNCKMNGKSSLIQAASLKNILLVLEKMKVKKQKIKLNVLRIVLKTF